VTAKISDIPVLLITAAAFVVLVAGMKAAAAILIPFLLAVFIATLCSPLLYWLQRRGVPNGLAVFISLFFWGWVLGPIGMLLSVPLTMIAKIALASSDDTRWLAVLLE
jgi:predicted PurR-regulated permease PerM